MMLDHEYSLIGDKLRENVEAAEQYAKNNLQNLNVLLEGFYREFLNLLYGWSLINANQERPNFPGADLIDRKKKIAVQVSGKVDHDKVQQSLDKFQEYLDTCHETANWKFYFLPVQTKDYKPAPFIPSKNVKKTIILNMSKLLNDIQHSDAWVRQSLKEFLYLEKLSLWVHFDVLLRETRRNHPSFRLMEEDEIDRRLFPSVSGGTTWDAMATEEGDQAPSPLWEKVQEIWKAKENHSVVIEGGGGIGKTVSLLSLTDKEGRWCPAPAVYIPMHRLINQAGNCVDLSDYLKSLSETYGQKFIMLAERHWKDGPQAILLLDGFNEIPTEKRRQVLDMVKKWRVTRPGAQLIAVSRPMDGLDLGEELAGNSFFFSLEPLSENVVKDYLKERGISLPILWEELQYPLFLTLYVKTRGLEGQKVAGYTLAPKPPCNGSALIWNYLQRELLKYQDAEPKLAEDWVLRCSVACEYILPYVAYNMERKAQFDLHREDALYLVKEAVNTLGPVLPTHLQDMFDQYYEEHLEKPNLKTVNWKQTVLRDVGILVSSTKKDYYTLLHQNFRDVLAALHLVNQAEMMRNHDLPALWRQGHSSLLLDRAAQLLKLETAQELWKANQQLNPTQASATYTQLELQKRVHRGEKFPLDFSGMDLREISLYHYLTDKEKDLNLLRRKEDASKTKLSLKTFHAQGHTGSIYCVAMTSDGLCVSGSWDYTLRVWDLRTGECLRVLKGHTGIVRCVTVTSNGLCISGSSDNTLRVWDLKTWECLRVLKGHTGTVRCVTVNPDGLCVSGSNDNTLRVWDLKTWECLRVLEGHTHLVNCVAVTLDNLCISGSYDYTIRVWDLHTGECLRVLNGHMGEVRCVTVAPGGLCVSGSSDHTLRVWDLSSEKCLRELKGHTAPVTCVTVVSGGLCISGSWDKTLRVWDLKTWECIRILEGHTDSVTCVTVTPGGLCISGSWDKTIQLWNLSTGENTNVLVGRIFIVNCVAVLSGGLYISGYDDHTLRVWHPRTRECLWVLEGHTAPVSCIAVTSDSLCISGSWDNALRVWDLKTWECLRVLKGHTDSITCVAVTSDGLCISGSWDKTLRVWDMKTGKCHRVLKKHTAPVTCVTVTSNGLCISGSYDGALLVWDLNTWQCLSVMEGHTKPVSCIASTPSGLCVSGSYDNTLRVWNPSTGKFLRVMEGHSDWVTCVAVTPNGLCISGSIDHTLRLWDCTTGKCLRLLKGHIDRVNCVAIISDGLIVSGSDDQTLRTWNLNTGECLCLLEPFDLDLTAMDLSLADLDRETADYFALKGIKRLSPTVKGELP